MIPVILSGGSGSRLWPMSRTSYPKQFHKILGDHSLLQEAILRLPDFVLEDKAGLIITNQAHRFITNDQLKDINYENRFNLILEPVGKGTAAAIAIAALLIQEKHSQDAIMVVLSSDHIIDDLKQFEQSLLIAQSVAKEGCLVTLGIQPSGPETGYGYIEADQQAGNQASYRVRQFIEKPNLQKATEFIKNPNFYWNSGIFVFQVGTILEQFMKYAPKTYDIAIAAVAAANSDGNLVWMESNTFNQFDSDSIDYAIMEKSEHVMMVPFCGQWSDVGSWSSIWQESKKDASGNVGHGDVLLENVQNSYVTANHRLVGVVDLDNIVVVETADAVLVANKDSSQSVKKLVAQLKVNERSEEHDHHHVYRPWGSYEILSTGDHYQVKRLILNPGARISVQYHHHRSEHWVVIAGVARVRVGEQYMTLSQNQSSFIPVGVIHSLENAGDTTLEVIEVQSGSYLGEDDIVRLEDYYGRS